MKTRSIRLDEVSVQIIPTYEDGLSYRDPMYIKGFGDDVARMIDDHGVWGWCSVNVKVMFGPIEGNAHLGGCSYAGEDDFKAGAYYDQLLAEAMEDLQKQVDEFIELING